MLCPVCGNEIESSSGVCPWCEAVLHKSRNTKHRGSKLRSINIKIDQPTAETALNRMIRAIHGAKADGVKVLKIIHGYGSSGVGGEIRYAVREYLDQHKYAPLIKYYVTGENFSRSFPTGKKIIQQFPFLTKDSDYNRRNQGITLIVV